MTKKAVFISDEKPIVVFRQHLNDPCLGCQGFTIISDDGKFKLQGSYTRGCGFGEKDDTRSYADILNAAKLLRDHIDQFIVDGKAAAIAALEADIAKMKGKEPVVIKNRFMRCLKAVKAVKTK